MGPTVVATNDSGSGPVRPVPPSCVPQLRPPYSRHHRGEGIPRLSEAAIFPPIFDALLDHPRFSVCLRNRSMTLGWAINRSYAASWASRFRGSSISARKHAACCGLRSAHTFISSEIGLVAPPFVTFETRANNAVMSKFAVDVRLGSFGSDSILASRALRTEIPASLKKPASISPRVPVA